MREIIFRGKSIETGKWVYGDLHQGYMGTRIIEELETPPTMSDPCGGIETLCHAVNSETIGQFTGLYDSTKWDDLTYEEQIEFMERYHLHPEDWKGKEIYEGDIVQLDYITTIGKHRIGLLFEIKWCTQEGCWVGWDGFSENTIQQTNKMFVVKGNIYDNPELINE